MPQKSVCIIGAGIGGMSAGIRLARRGYDVTVFEKEKSYGGKASSVGFGGFTFDTGPSLVTMYNVIEELFSDSGEDIKDYLTVSKLDVLCRYFYPGGTILNAFQDFEKFAAEIEKNTTDKRNSLEKYLKYAKKIYDLTADIFLYNSDKSVKNFLTAKSFKTLFSIAGIDPFRTMHKANRSFFSDDKLVRLFDRYATYNGSNPYLAPATLNIISYVENSLGGYYFEGGMRALPEALYKLAVKKGVNFRFGEKVKSIEKMGSEITAVITGYSRYEFDYYISNADALVTNSELLKDGKKIKENELSTSALVFYWGIEGLADGLETHNILFADDYKQEFDDLSVNKTVHNDPTVYIYISSKFNKSDAPENCSNWFVMVNAPADSGQDWGKESSRLKEIILRKIKSLTGIDISGKIKAEKILSPEMLEEITGSYKGSIYGYSSNSKFSAFLRTPNKSGRYKNLFYCGGSSHPGGGIPLVILSGRNAAAMIEKLN
ncbi:MAG: phytoene desaturase family protein [Ignavibacteria bacterium]|nr:phytoene desaturase family protein [Ignavibacteria bacterium]